MAVAIFVLATGIVSGFAITFYRGQTYLFQQSTAINEARKGVETMVKQLREAKTGDDGSYIIEKAEDYEIIFYSDIDKDGSTERVRYFIYESLNLSNNYCTAYPSGGFCSINLNNFSLDEIDSAQVEICTEGDLNGGNEYVDVFADSQQLGTLCQAGCNQCLGQWEGCTTFDVTSQASDGSISFTTDSSSAVGSGMGGFCDWEEPNHSMKARFNFSWTETNTNQTVTLYKAITEPTDYPIKYLEENETVSGLSQHITNTLPIFRYFDEDGKELLAPTRLEDTKLIRVHLIINVNPRRTPDSFELESNVQIRNLKTNL